MKRFSLFLFMMFVSLFTLAQPKTVDYKKEHDFMLLVLENPKVSIRDFLRIGCNEKNTQFLSEEQYKQYRVIQRLCKERTGSYTAQSFHKVYQKVAVSWKVLREMQYIDRGLLWDPDPFDYLDPYYQYREEHPEVIHKLSIVPLMLDDIR